MKEGKKCSTQECVQFSCLLLVRFSFFLSSLADLTHSVHSFLFLRGVEKKKTDAFELEHAAPAESWHIERSMPQKEHQTTESALR